MPGVKSKHNHSTSRRVHHNLSINALILFLSKRPLCTISSHYPDNRKNLKPTASRLEYRREYPTPTKKNSPCKTLRG